MIICNCGLHYIGNAPPKYCFNCGEKLLKKNRIKIKIESFKESAKK